MRKSWVAWQFEYREGKWTKPPRQVNGAAADATDASTWASFDDVIGAYRKGNFDGIGWVLTDDDAYTGIDLDHCRNPETGVIAPWAVEIIRKLHSYTEVSPSGAGIRIIVRAHKPAGSCCRKGNIEVYDHARYLTFTGHTLDESLSTIEPRQAELEQFLIEVFGETKKNEPNQNHAGNGNRNAAAADHAALIDSARKSRQGDKFSALYDRGDWQGGGYGSQSEADLSLCSSLAFWFKGDRAAIDRAFRASALYRDKWDREDYRERTIDEALSGKTEFYNPERRDDNQHKEESGPSTAREEQAGDDWSDPIPLAAPPPPAIPIEAFPAAIRDMISALSAETETPPELAGGMAIGVLSGVCQRRFVVKVSASHSEPLMAWVVVALPSGERKNARTTPHDPSVAGMGNRTNRADEVRDCARHFGA
jgi:primase-polymerase (primpol)-like protein